MEAPHEESREPRRETGLHVPTRGAESWKQLGACVHPVTRLGNGRRQRA
jgi:hypothetical protein